jgi:hypothetical protein
MWVLLNTAVVLLYLNIRTRFTALSVCSEPQICQVSRNITAVSHIFFAVWLSPGPAYHSVSQQTKILVEADYSGFQFLQTGNLVLSASYQLAGGGSSSVAHSTQFMERL